jgi:hypothetical protein
VRHGHDQAGNRGDGEQQNRDSVHFGLLSARMRDTLKMRSGVRKFPKPRIFWRTDWAKWPRRAAHKHQKNARPEQVW